MVIDALRSQGVNYEFNLINGNSVSKINPSTSDNVLETEQYFCIKKILEENIGKQDPNLLSLASENLMLYLSDIYPFKTDEKDYNFIAYCIHLYSLKMYGEENINTLGDIYNVDKSNEDKILNQLQTACSI